MINISACELCKRLVKQNSTIMMWDLENVEKCVCYIMVIEELSFCSEVLFLAFGVNRLFLTSIFECAVALLYCTWYR